MALVNCTINSSVVAVTANQAVSSTANQVLTITPDPGYVVAAADFTKQSPPTGISSITLADKNNDTGGAGTPSNGCVVDSVVSGRCACWLTLCCIESTPHTQHAVGSSG